VSIPFLVLLVVDGLIIATLIAFFPSRNKSLDRLVRSAKAPGTYASLTEEGDGDPSFVDRMTEALYWSKGLTPPPLVALLSLVTLPAIAGLLMAALGEGLVRALGLVVLLLGPALVYLDSSRRATSRRKQFQELLPQFLLTVSSAMAAGLTLEQALTELSSGKTTVVEEEFHRATQGLALGETLESSLRDMARRLSSPDVETMQKATAIGRQTGSSLTPILEAVAESALERSQVKREIGALTAEGMMSAYVVIALPFIVFIFLLLSQPGYISVLWSRPEGIAMGVGALVLIAAGWVWLRSLITKETSGL